jgi:hypothetical protein
MVKKRIPPVLILLKERTDILNEKAECKKMDSDSWHIVTAHPFHMSCILSELDHGKTFLRHP